jgi:hypothetical protein
MTLITCRKCGVQFGSIDKARARKYKRTRLCWTCEKEEAAPQFAVATLAGSASPYAPPDSMACAHCGDVPPADAVFCVTCGATLPRVGKTIRLH